MKTAVLEARVDIRHLATCAAFFERKGAPATSKSDLLYSICSAMASAIKREEGYKVFESYEEACDYLNAVGLGPMTRKKGKYVSGQRELSQAIGLERGGDNEYDAETEMKEQMKKILNDLRKKPINEE